QIGYHSVDVEHVGHGEAADLGALELIPEDAVAHGAEALQADDGEEEAEGAGHDRDAVEVRLADDEAFDAFAIAADQRLSARETVESNECGIMEDEGAHDGGRWAG